MDGMRNPAEAVPALIPAATLPTILAADEENLLGQLAAKVAAFKPDVSTEVGRAAMRSLAYEVSTTKGALLRLGKGLTEGWRKSTKAVNAECNIIEEKLNALRDEVRGPLTDWENAETQRVADHEAALAAIVAPPHWGRTESSAEIAERIRYLVAYPARDWEEFVHRATHAIGCELDRAQEAYAAALKREADALELARLRAAEAVAQQERQEREAREREAQIAEEAAENARLEAERRARADRDAAAEALARAEREKQEAEDRARRAEEQAERDRIAAEQRAERDRAAAVEAERRRAEAEAEAKRKEDEARAANVAHRTVINREALAVIQAQLVTAGVGTVAAEHAGGAIVTAVAKGEVPHVSIQY